ncbi:hypothetical protein BJX96DRAFT_21526 [Aspergillus floccosus]
MIRLVAVAPGTSVGTPCYLHTAGYSCEPTILYSMVSSTTSFALSNVRPPHLRRLHHLIFRHVLFLGFLEATSQQISVFSLIAGTEILDIIASVRPGRGVDTRTSYPISQLRRTPDASVLRTSNLQ